MGWGHAAPLSAGLGARSGFPYIAASDPTRCQRVTQGGRTQRDGGSCRHFPGGTFASPDPDSPPLSPQGRTGAMRPEGHPEKVCGSQEVRWGGREAAGPGRFAVPLRGPSRWLFLATRDGQIPLREEKQSRRSCRPQAEGLGGGGRAGRADVCLALTLTRAEACGAASLGGGPHPLLWGSAGVLGVPAALPVAPHPAGSPAAAWPALLGLPRSVAVGGVAPSPPQRRVRGGSPAAPGRSAAPPHCPRPGPAVRAAQ